MFPQTALSFLCSRFRRRTDSRQRVSVAPSNILHFINSFTERFLSPYMCTAEVALCFWQTPRRQADMEKSRLQCCSGGCSGSYISHSEAVLANEHLLAFLNDTGLTVMLVVHGLSVSLCALSSLPTHLPHHSTCSAQRCLKCAPAPVWVFCRMELPKTP